MSSIATLTIPNHRDLLSKIRGAPVRKNQTHRSRWHEAKNGERKHKGVWA